MPPKKSVTKSSPAVSKPGYGNDYLKKDKPSSQDLMNNLDLLNAQVYSDIIDSPFVCGSSYSGEYKFSGKG